MITENSRAAYERGYKAGFDQACKMVVAKIEELIAEKQRAGSGRDPGKTKSPASAPTLTGQAEKPTTELGLD